MYAETELMFPYFHNFPQEVQQLEEFGCSYRPNASMGTQSSIIQTSSVSDYSLWGAPIIEEPVMGLDPMTAGISMISCGEDVMSSQSLTVSDIESSIESGQLLSEVFYECRKDILAKDGNETPFSEVLNINIPIVKTDDENSGAIQKSVSSSCLRSMDDYVHEASLRPNFLDFPVMDFDAVYGMRRAFSDGDIKDRARSLILRFYDRLSIMVIRATSNHHWRNLELSTLALLNIEGNSYPDTGVRNPREILAERSSTLAGKLWPIASQEFGEDLPRLKRRKFRRSNNRTS